MENKKKKEVIYTSFEYVGDEFFSLDDGMMMQFFSILLSKTSSTVPLLFIAPLMLIRGPSTIWYSHKLFSPSGWHWNEMYRERKRAQRKKIRGKERKINTGGKRHKKQHIFLSHLERTFLSCLECGFFLPRVLQLDACVDQQVGDSDQVGRRNFWNDELIIKTLRGKKSKHHFSGRFNYNWNKSTNVSQRTHDVHK